MDTKENNSLNTLPNDGDIIEGPFWPDRVIVKGVKQLSDKVQINSIEEKSGNYTEKILDEKQLATVKKINLNINFSGKSNQVFLALCATMLRYAYQFNPLYAMDYSQIKPLPHQIDAVYNYILKNPQIRFLLADDPGAGKTIMAGLVIKELKERGLIKNILIIVPGALQDQWQIELEDKFKEKFSIVAKGEVGSKNWKSIWKEWPQIITSLDFAKQDHILASMDEASWDLIIVDEAHKMAASQSGNDIKKTKRYKLGEVLSAKSESLLLLTATPHSGNEDSFRLFLNLLIPGLFLNNKIVQEYMKSKDGVLYLRRIKEKLNDLDGKPLFPPRQVRTVDYELNESEWQLYNAVTLYVKTSYNKAINKDNRNVAFALLILQRRMASSLEAIAISLSRRREKLIVLKNTGIALLDNKKMSEEDIDEIEDLNEVDRWKEEDKLLKLTSAETLEELEEEIRELGLLIKMANKLKENGDNETKLKKLREIILPGIKDEKLLIFTESRDTLNHLIKKIESWNYEVTHIDGSMSHENRKQAQKDFKERAQIMISTEAGGEGINLQFCHLMINYDIPWNPNRLEQRMGRIHRYGQKRSVDVANIIAKGTVDGEIFKKLFEKLENIKVAFGKDRVFDVLGEILPESELRKIIVEIITKKNIEGIDKIIENLDIPKQIKEKLDLALKESSVLPPLTPSDAKRQMQLSEETKLEPEFAEYFFLMACKELGHLNVKKGEGGILIIPKEVYFNLKGSTISHADFSGPIRATFYKTVAEEQSYMFLTPSHDVVKGLTNKILVEYDTEVKKGATFTDPSGKLNGRVWFLKGQINYGDNKIAEQRIIAIYQPHGNKELTEISPMILWALETDTEKAVSQLEGSDVEQVKIFTIDKLLPTRIAELRKETERVANIREKYGIQSLNLSIDRSKEKIENFEKRRIAGENLGGAISNEKEKLTEHIKNKDKLEKSINAIRNLSSSPPQILGVISVVPGMKTENRSGVDAEWIGLEHVMKHEKSRNRDPEDISTQNLGYDIRSISKDNVTVRYIEVKTRSIDGKGITMTANEWLKAHRFKDQYWLYVVIVDGKNRNLFTIQDPANHLHPDEQTGVVSYNIKDWKDFATLEDN